MYVILGGVMELASRVESLPVDEFLRISDIGKLVY